MVKGKAIDITLRVIAIVLAVLIVLIGAFYGFWRWFTKDMTDEVYVPNESGDINNEMIFEDNIIEDIPDATPAPTDAPDATPTDKAEPQPSALDKLKQNILAWKDAGQPAKEDGVTNILLIGADIDTPDMNKNSRADAMMVVSINHNTKKITLASIMRDQYCYIENGAKSKFEKLHHACAYGGPRLQIQMFEKYYKISIDNYVFVNLYSLPRIIDALGGVTLTINEDEARELSAALKTELKAGTVQFSGSEALKYMRLRKNAGGDTARVGRQRNVIVQVIKKMADSNVATAASLVTSLRDYVRTGYSSNQMLSLVTDAVTKGWFKYEIAQLTLPDSTCAEGMWVGSVWYWKVDIPVAAQKLQYALYGKTNIKLDANRKSWI